MICLLSYAPSNGASVAMCQRSSSPLKSWRSKGNERGVMNVTLDLDPELVLKNPWLWDEKTLEWARKLIEERAS